jgi:hypothetical protein
LVADRATTRCTPRWRASASNSAAASLTARGCRNRAVTPSSDRAIVSGRVGSPNTTSTSAGRLAACGAGECADLDVLVDEDVDEGTSDGAGGSGYEEHGKPFP